MQNLLTRFGSFLWRMHLILIMNIILVISITVAVVVLQGTSEDIYFGIIVFFLLTPYTLLFKPKTVLSRNILFMSLYTYFTIPFTLNIWVLPLNISISKFLFSIFLTSILIFILLYFYNRKNHLKEFIDHSKLSLDIIRFIFVVILTLTTVYAMIDNDFSSFKSIFEYNASIEELRKSYQLTFRLLAIPFVFSASVLRIAIDWISLKK
ncbi:hypothetical protein NLX71_02525 [Paenibacillus sp. MZ04-78.2]|uniref:hypothetical protein n=1 Tax=Paenibacillus sp. MZ04-78.2 TaxID=2962034 RepID=UPI0020B796FE|nr:hypothetical protein [Paenibacillus sp. MZ04-78.2]MCP3772193.1 hypothetical protein [Paenibacillus sp. MZ04-78.2]